MQVAQDTNKLAPVIPIGILAPGSQERNWGAYVPVCALAEEEELCNGAVEGISLIRRQADAGGAIPDVKEVVASGCLGRVGDEMRELGDHLASDVGHDHIHLVSRGEVQVHAKVFVLVAPGHVEVSVQVAEVRNELVKDSGAGIGYLYVIHVPENGELGAVNGCIGNTRVVGVYFESLAAQVAPELLIEEQGQL